jgi:hypothetical protein
MKKLVLASASLALFFSPTSTLNAQSSSNLYLSCNLRSNTGAKPPQGFRNIRLNKNSGTVYLFNPASFEYENMCVSDGGFNKNCKVDANQIQFRTTGTFTFEQKTGLIENININENTVIDRSTGRITEMSVMKTASGTKINSSSGICKVGQNQLNRPKAF